MAKFLSMVKYPFMLAISFAQTMFLIVSYLVGVARHYRSMNRDGRLNTRELEHMNEDLCADQLRSGANSDSNT